MHPLLGGLLIGFAAAALLLSTGRILGVSGIVGGLLSPQSLKEKKWRILFLLGLFSGGVIIRFFMPESFLLTTKASSLDYIFAGLLVGVGTTMGSGCTSGHGVCGISRFSPRSFVSTTTFILFGMIGFFIAKLIRGGF